MKKFVPLVGALLAALAVAPDVEAGPFRNRGAKPACTTCAPTSGGAVSIGCGPNGCVLGSVQSVNFAAPGAAPVPVGGSALDEVNAKRRAFGLSPLIEDPLLTAGAQAVARYRAERLLFGHTSNDFAFLPVGAAARSAGCAAYDASYGWMSCCVRDAATYGGAAWVTGRDGKRYMHLFVR